jgi:hypothetical protein
MERWVGSIRRECVDRMLIFPVRLTATVETRRNSDEQEVQSDSDCSVPELAAAATRTSTGSTLLADLPAPPHQPPSHSARDRRGTGDEQ